MLTEYFGFKIVSSPNLMDTQKHTVERTWKERLFSFTPFTPNKTITIMVPSKQIIQVGNKLYMHPDLIRKLELDIAHDLKKSGMYDVNKHSVSEIPHE